MAKKGIGICLGTCILVLGPNELDIRSFKFIYGQFYGPKWTKIYSKKNLKIPCSNGHYYQNFDIEQRT